ncbi:MAG: cobalamin-independent methionine synthase II family protein [Alphaproteobacteria bacterium]|nr:cobalamin-independent methionine synthase II family protein [Alphaproteobacteria bacterium]
MRLSTDRILTTHVGSLPRPEPLGGMLLDRDAGKPVDVAEFEATVKTTVGDVVRQQVDAGIDIVSDGEMSKIGYATYIKDRASGFSGDSPRRVPADLELYPTYLKAAAERRESPTIQRPMCTAEVKLTDNAPLERDIANLTAALDGVGATEGFMNAASPGVICAFLPNEHYATEDDYLEALAALMQPEYEAIHAAGLVIQLDCPDLAMARHMQYKAVSDEEFLARADAHIEVLNAALANVPAEATRLHLCWGNYEGPHVCDIPAEKLMPVLRKVKAQVISFEASNPRHAHEWTDWRDANLPDDKVLMPGVIDTVSNFVEHPKLVAERICRFADFVGRERVLAGTDCGFGTFAGFGKIDPDICYAKLKTLAEGAEIASQRLW